MFSTIASLLSSTVITAVITWMVSQQKSKVEIEKLQAETDTIQLKNLGDLINIYKKISDDLKSELQQVKEQMTALQKENHALRGEIRNLRKSIEQQ